MESAVGADGGTGHHFAVSVVKLNVFQGVYSCTCIESKNFEL
jgi:hypothetical protein